MPPALSEAPHMQGSVVAGVVAVLFLWALGTHGFWSPAIFTRREWSCQYLPDLSRAQELCESRGGRPGLPSLISLMVSVDVKQHFNEPTDLSMHASTTPTRLAIYPSIHYTIRLSVQSCHPATICLFLPWCFMSTETVLFIGEGEEWVRE